MFNFKLIQRELLLDKALNCKNLKVEVNLFPCLDILNKLEKYGCINNAKEWLYLRKLRNEVAHQYDDEPKALAQAINAVVVQKKIIEEIYSKLKKCIENPF